MIPLLLATALTAQSPLGVETLRPDQGPAIQVHRQESPLVALRLSVPTAVDLPEGAVELLQELARPDAEAAAHRFGARLLFRHGDGRAVIAVAGPATAFDALAAILRRAVDEPDLSAAALRRARARAEDRVLARLEQPGPRVRRLLRHALYGGPEPRGSAVGGLTPEAVRSLRRSVYARDRTQVVLVGSVPDAVVRSAFARWPEGTWEAGVQAEPDGEAVRPQANREWGGIAFPVEDDPAVLTVAAELVQQRVAGSALRYGAVEAWHQPTPALALIGAATPGDTVIRVTAGISDLAVRDDDPVPATDVRRYLRRLIAEAAALAGPDAVTNARQSIRRRLLLEARTAAGRAEVIGRIVERGQGDPGAFLTRLEDVDLDAVRAVLARVLETPAVVAEGG